MLKTYKPIFEVELRHAYFAKQFANVFSVRPTKQTHQLMQLADLKIRQKDLGKFQVYYGIQGDQPARLKAEMEEAPKSLTFLISITDPFFLNYSELPYTSFNTRKFFFTNQGLPADSLLLFKGKKEDVDAENPPTSVGDADIYNFKLPDIQNVLAQLPPGEKDAEQLAIMKNTRGKMVVEWPVKWDEKGERWVIENYSFQGTPGKYFIEVGDLKTDVFVYGSRELKESDFGLIEIQLSDETGPLPVFPSLEGEGPKEPVSLKVQFQNRSIFWRYHIISRPREKETVPPPYTYSIQTNTTDVFESMKESPFKEKVNEKETVTSFQSKSRILLKEPGAVSVDFKLEIKDPTAVGTPPVISLPVPQPGMVNAVRDENKEIQFYSDMYIYL
jgi:hypothetical protein